MRQYYPFYLQVRLGRLSHLKAVSHPGILADSVRKWQMLPPYPRLNLKHKSFLYIPAARGIPLQLLLQDQPCIA